jgi:hypothetical protein
MDKQIIADIAEDAAELGRQLAAKGIRTSEAQAQIVAGAMRGFVAYEVDVLRRAKPVDQLGRGDIGPRDPGGPRHPVSPSDEMPS